MPSSTRSRYTRPGWVMANVRPHGSSRPGRINGSRTAALTGAPASAVSSAASGGPRWWQATRTARATAPRSSGLSSEDAGAGSMLFSPAFFAVHVQPGDENGTPPQGADQPPLQARRVRVGERPDEHGP